MINQFTIYGERHSGTNFLKHFICQSFQLIHTEQFGHKHFFTPLHLENQKIDNTIFFCIARNPYDWLIAMYKKPYYCAINHKNNIEKFLLSEWWSREEFLGPEIYEDRNWLTGNRYKNIFELRQNKLLYLHKLQFYNKYTIQYENFLQHRNLLFIKHNISCQFRIKNYSHQIAFKKQKSHFLLITNKIFQIINNYTDWEVEKLFGYYKFDSYDDFLLKYNS